MAVIRRATSCDYARATPEYQHLFECSDTSCSKIRLRPDAVGPADARQVPSPADNRRKTQRRSVAQPSSPADVEHASSWYEDLRDLHKPEGLRYLLIGESPPDPGRGGLRFFYSPTLTADNLYRGVAAAVYGHEQEFDVRDKPAVLGRLRDDGFWLIDAVDSPVNKLGSSARARAINAAVPALVERCSALAPDRGVIICHSKVYEAAADSLRAADVLVLHDRPLPFPLGNWRAKLANLGVLSALVPRLRGRRGSKSAKFGRHPEGWSAGSPNNHPEGAPKTPNEVRQSSARSGALPAVNDIILRFGSDALWRSYSREPLLQPRHLRHQGIYMTSSSSPVRILIVGKDARTDAIATACSASVQRPVLFGLTEMLIPGLVQKCHRVKIGSLTDVGVAVKFAQEVNPDLVIIGPEEPLAAGFADDLLALDIPVFGPPRQLARIESSKSWARELLDRHGIPGNPDYRLFDASAGLRQYMEDLAVFVVKPDGLTAGKGVRVFGEHLHSIEEALQYAEGVLAQSGKVQIEERLEGEEFSLQTITDGETCIHCPLVQDHKRAFEGDQGPNTGGMGSYSCADFSLPFLDSDEVAEAQSINEQVIEALASDTGQPYRGVLYGGFMATRSGVRLIEYNSRFGDPEAMNVLPLLDADFVELCAAAAVGELARVDYSWKRKATVCKYIVPRAYPNPSPTRERLVVRDDTRMGPDLQWYWAACEQQGNDVLLTSSRSGGFVGIGDTLEAAEHIAERAASDLEISSEGIVRHRSDIGRADVIAARVAHMRYLRRSTVRLGGHQR